MQDKSEAQKLADLFSGCSQLSHGTSFDLQNADGSLQRDEAGKVQTTHDHKHGAASLEDYENHLAGTNYLGLVLATESGFSTFAAIDDDRYLNPPEGHASWPDYFRQYSLVKAHNLNVLPTRSGGTRLLARFDRPVPTKSARRWMEHIAFSVLVLPKGTEIFPKQDQVCDSNIGTYVCLPFHGEGRVSDLIYSKLPPDVVNAAAEEERKDIAYGLHIREGVDVVGILRAAGLKWRGDDKQPKAVNGKIELHYHVATGRCLIKNGLHKSNGNESNPRCSRFVWDEENRLLWHNCFDSDCQQIEHRTRAALENLGVRLSDLIDFTADYTEQALLASWVRVDSSEVKYLPPDKVWMEFKDGLWVQRHEGPKKRVGSFLKSCSPGLPDLVDRQGAKLAKAQSSLHYRLNSASLVKSILYLATGEPDIYKLAEEFDPDPWMLGLPDGNVIDLRSKRQRRAVPSDFITKQVRVVPDFRPNACPTFDRFLCEIQPNANIRAFMKRYAGYCLSADTSEQNLVFFVGSGGTGKNTYLKVFESTLGPYYRTIPRTLLLASTKEEYRDTEMGQFPGVRLGAVSETDSQTSYDANILKDLSGGGKMNGRRRYEDSFEFKPVLKVLIIGNKDPHLNQIDGALKQRVQVVRFTQQFRGTDRDDKELWKKLEPEYPGVLAWIMEGCSEWQQVGLQPPSEVTVASEAYFSEADLFEKWLAECTAEVAKPVTGWSKDNLKGFFTPSGDLFKSWQAFCRASGCERESGNLGWFCSSLLEKRGEKVEKARPLREAGGSGFYGILLTEAEWQKLTGDSLF